MGGGKIYGVPMQQVLYNQKGISFNKELLDKYGFTDYYNQAKSYEDLEEIYDVVLAGESADPTFAITASNQKDYFIPETTKVSGGDITGAVYIVDGEVTVSPEAFGLLSQGILNVSKVKTGVVTMCRLTTENGKYVIHMVVGEGVTPPKWEEAGWAQPAPQLPALKVLLKDTEDFTEKVMGQHYIISYGDNSKLIKEFCKIANIEVI